MLFVEKWRSGLDLPLICIVLVCVASSLSMPSVFYEQMLSHRVLLFGLFGSAETKLDSWIRSGDAN